MQGMQKSRTKRYVTIDFENLIIIIIDERVHLIPKCNLFKPSYLCIEETIKLMEYIREKRKRKRKRKLPI